MLCHSDNKSIFLYVSHRKHDVVQKGREEIVQQRPSERPVGENSPERGGPVQTGGWTETEKLH